MRTLCLASMVAALSGLALGCGTDPVTPAPDAMADAPAPDAAVEAGAEAAVEAGADVAPDRPRQKIPSDIYGPCNADSECVEGLTCNTEAATGFPGGQCNRTCTSDNDCVLFPSDGSAPVDGWCRPAVGDAPRTCMRVCANGIDCERPGAYSCRVFNAGALNQVSACVPVCSAETCVNGTTCNADTGLCRPAGSTPTGRALGQSCEPTMRAGSPTPPADMQCRSQLCNAEWTPDSRGNRFYNGWNGGYCLARCLLPEGYGNGWPAEMRLPQANCPSGGVCVPDGSATRGDLGLCLQGCTANSDCRAAEGYFCQKRRQITQTMFRTYPNGYCVPVNCVTATTPCPSGFTCRRNAAGTAGTCIPSMAAP